MKKRWSQLRFTTRRAAHLGAWCSAPPIVDERAFAGVTMACLLQVAANFELQLQLQLLLFVVISRIATRARMMPWIADIDNNHGARGTQYPPRQAGTGCVAASNSLALSTMDHGTVYAD